jgi:hypothetical protein
MKTLLNDSINTKDNGEDDISLSSKGCSGVNGVNGVDGVDVANSVSGVSGVSGVSSGNFANTVGNTDSSIQASVVNATIPKQKFSSSMKFYLLKKKFMKQNTSYSNCLENDLTYEDYLIT